MAKSDIELCNVALGMLGQRSIFSFDSAEYGDNALLCKNNYRRGHRFILSRVDWPFARSIATLNKVYEPETALDEGYAIYALPNLCVRPLGLRPPFHKLSWEVVAEGLMTVDVGDGSEGAEVHPRLSFTKEITDPTKFSEAFSEILVSYMVAKLAGPIAGLNPKETAYFDSLFLTKLDTFAPSDLNAQQGSPVGDREVDLDTFNRLE